METRTRRVGALEMEVEDNARSLLDQFRDFAIGTRYVALLHRTKDGGHNKEYKRRGAYFVTHTPEEYEDALVRLLTLQAVSSKPYRLYASVNARDIHKAEKAFKMDMLQVDFDGYENKEFFYQRLESKWVSALMQPGSRFKNESKFMLDVDGDGAAHGEVLKWLGQNGIEPVTQYKTPNGWHIITEPFNPEEFQAALPTVEVKKDGLLLLSA